MVLDEPLRAVPAPRTNWGRAHHQSGLSPNHSGIARQGARTPVRKLAPMVSARFISGTVNILFTLRA
jgi:hypothetical protein